MTFDIQAEYRLYLLRIHLFGKYLYIVQACTFTQSR